ncbi:hypothetical protein [Streptomyces sp. NPDC050738]|uniref:hypothetical protein n=1 Tax=Streptomyces sp. NPDC050738 TaxID=3154744 RepID=UPI003426C92F
MGLIALAVLWAVGAGEAVPGRSLADQLTIPLGILIAAPIAAKFVKRPVLEALEESGTVDLVEGDAFPMSAWRVSGPNVLALAAAFAVVLVMAGMFTRSLAPAGMEFVFAFVSLSRLRVIRRWERRNATTAWLAHGPTALYFREAAAA